MFRTSFGRRLWKQAGDETTLFFYSDEGLVAEYDPTGVEIRAYGYRPDSTWTTDPLWLKENGEYYFYHNDHLGTPQKLVQQNGAVLWSASSTAFGQATVEVETITNNLRFPGQYYDAETGLHYNFHRYYAPATGRYLRKDQIGLKGGINQFIYTFNNPLANFDPDGNLVISVPVAIALAMGLLGVYIIYDYTVDHSPCYSCLFAKGKNKGIPWWKKTPWQKSGKKKKKQVKQVMMENLFKTTPNLIRNNRSMKASVAILLALTTIFFLNVLKDANAVNPRW